MNVKMFYRVINSASLLGLITLLMACNSKENTLYKSGKIWNYDVS